MFAALVLLFLQGANITGSLVAPVGGAIGTAQVVLLPDEYAQVFNAEAQQRIDRYWETYKPEFAQRKELFLQVSPMAFRDALEVTMLRMRRDTKIDTGKYIRMFSGGQFEFRGVPPGDYKLVATATIGGVSHVWTESIQAGNQTLFLQIKNRVP